MKIDISHIATLANLTIPDDQKAKFETQLSSILSHIENLSEVDTTGVIETSQVTGLTNITREDVSRPSLTQKEAISQAKSTHNGHIAVKGIFDNE